MEYSYSIQGVIWYSQWHTHTLICARSNEKQQHAIIIIHITYRLNNEQQRQKFRENYFDVIICGADSVCVCVQ